MIAAVDEGNPARTIGVIGSIPGFVACSFLRNYGGGLAASVETRLAIGRILIPGAMQLDANSAIKIALDH